MEPMRTLIAAGLRRDKGTFIGLAVLLFLAAAALSFTICLFSDLSGRASELYDEAGCGDVFTSDWGFDLDDDAIARLEALPEVGEVRRTPSFSAPTQFEDADGAAKNEESTDLALFEAWGAGIGANVLAEGLGAYEQPPVPPAPGEVYVTPAARVLYGVEAGDVLVLGFGEGERRLTVAGFFEDPQLGTPFMGVKRYLVAPETFDELEALARDEAHRAQAAEVDAANIAVYPLTEIDVMLAPEAAAAGIGGQDLARIIQEDGGWGTSGTSVFSRETLVGYELMVVQVISALLAVFSLLLFAIALVLCVHSIAAAIEEGYADWGIAKAVGISPVTLRRSLVLQYALVSCAALAVGFAAGVALEPVAWPSFLLVTGVLVQASAFPAPALGCSALLLAIIAAAVALKARKLGRISPLAALRRGQGDVRFSPRGSCRIGGRRLEASLAWRAIVSQKRQYVGVGACALLLCAFIALCFGIGGSVSDDSAVYRVFGIWKSDVSVASASGGPSWDEVRAAIEEEAAIDREWVEASAMVNLDGEARMFVGLSDMGVLDEGCLVAGRMPRLPNEVAVGMNLARSMQLSVGDELMVDAPDGAERTLVVSGIAASVLNGGTGAMLTLEGLTELIGSDQAVAGAAHQYQLADGERAAAAQEHLQSRFGDAVAVESDGIFGSSANMILLIRDILVTLGYAMTAFAALLACVAVALVSRRMLAGERRDLGIYRALGFRSGALRLSFALRFLTVALIGSLVGAALVIVGGSTAVGSLFGLFGAGAFAISLPWWQAVLISVTLAAVFAIAAFAFSRSIRTAPIRVSAEG